jgi:tight adherence protein C
MSFVYYIIEQRNLAAILVAIAAFATILTLVLPMLQGDKLGSRMKSVSNRRDELRAKQKEDFARQNAKNKASLRPAPASFMKRVVDQFNLHALLDAEGARELLARAGYRGQPPLITFLFFRLLMPPIVLVLVLGYVFLINDFGLSPVARVAVSFLAAAIGFFLPNVFVKNVVQRRQEEIQTVFPDALDLLLLCVEAGMSVEAAFNKVAQEIGTNSVAMAEEMGLTTAELSFLPERRMAYENLAKRTGLPGVKAVCTSLVQAERYGTPVASGLRIMAKENRDLRMQEIEKKAASLPPKLTVPMILFFLPVLFIVILGPAAIKVMNM